jgi:putative endonuclease
MWFIYLVKCADGTLYCGITNDLDKRIKTHNDGKGAKYTKTRRPVSLLKYFERPTKGEALKLEYKIKQLSRQEKLNYQETK